MKLVDKVLVSTDFSAGARDALEMAVWVARHFQAQVVLLHVVPGKSERYSSAVDMLRMDVDRELQEAASWIRDEGVEQVETRVAFGVPFVQINHHAVETDANLIFLGGRDKSLDGPGGMGTTAAEVRRTASKPVWIVTRGTKPPVKSILCPVDFSAAAERALRNAIHLARGFAAKLTMLAVSPCSRSTPGLEEATARAKQQGVTPEAVLLDKFAQRFDLYNLEAEKVIRQGRPYDEILKLVDEAKTDLLVMGSMGRKGLARMLMGGVTRKVARAMPCSMVTVRSEHAVRVRLASEQLELEGHFKLGHELLALGFAEEAIQQFRSCITENNKHAPAWEGLAAAYERLGQHEDAQKCMEKADVLIQSLYNKEIEDSLRNEHFLFRPMFGTRD